MCYGYYYQNIESAKDKEKQRETNFMVIGHEGCVHRIPEKGELLELKKIYSNKKIHLITPLISQKNLECLKDKIEKIIENKLVDSISFNDLGIAYYFSNKYKNIDIEFYMGRLLMKSFSDCPWSEDIIKNENKITKEYMRGMTINDERKIKFFKQMGIDGVEVSIKKNNSEISEIKKQGFKIIGHVDTTIASASRICTQAAYNKREYPECIRFCKKSMIAELSEVWSFRQDGFTLPSEEVKRLVPRYYINGNISYYKTLISDEDIEKANYDHIVKADAI